MSLNRKMSDAHEAYLAEHDRPRWMSLTLSKAELGFFALT